MLPVKVDSFQVLENAIKYYLCRVPRIIGIDYGTKRIGLAVTDPLQIIATGLTTVATPDIFTFLKQYMSEEEVECMVIGEPKHADGNPTHLTPKINLFIEQLNKLFPVLRIERQEERFTSRDARQIILESGAKKKKRQDKGLVDKISAVLILQDFLQHR